MTDYRKNNTYSMAAFVLGVLFMLIFKETSRNAFSGLVEQKMFRKFRFLGKFHLVAVNAAGMATFDQKHCDHCLTNKSKKGDNLFPLCPGCENCLLLDITDHGVRTVAEKPHSQIWGNHQQKKEGSGKNINIYV